MWRQFIIIRSNIIFDTRKVKHSLKRAKDIMIGLKRNILFERWSYTFIARRRIGSYILCIAVHFAPRFVYLLEPILVEGRNHILNKSSRIPKTPNPLDDFDDVDLDISDKLSNMEEINIVFRGLSFDRKLLSSLKGPTFLMNWLEEPRINEDVPLVKGKDIYYVGSDQDCIRVMYEQGRTPIIYITNIRYDNKGKLIKKSFVINKNIKNVLYSDKNFIMATAHRSNYHNLQMSSVLAIAVLGKLAKKVNIFGWDQYLEFEPQKHGYWKVLFGLTHPTLKTNSPRPAHFSQALYNWHYGYRFSKLPGFNIHGRVSQLVYHPKIMEKIEKIFYQ